VTAYLCNRLFYATVWEHLDFKNLHTKCSPTIPWNLGIIFFYYVVYKLKYV